MCSLIDCDIFGYTPSFTIGRNSSYRTRLGGLLSLLIIGVILYATWHFGNEIIYRQKPLLIVTTYNDEEPKRINLTEGVFMLALGLQNPDYSLYINESIYHLEAKQVIITRNGQGETEMKNERIEMVRCSEKDIKLIPEYFDLMDLNNLYCIKNGSDLFIEGEFGRSWWAYLEFTFRRCKNSSLLSHYCQSNEEISKRLEGGYYGMFVTDINLSPSNYTHAAQIFGKNIFSTFSIGAYRDFWINMKTLQVNSDSGWIMDEWQLENYFAIDFLREAWDLRDTSDVFFTSYIRCSPSRQVVDRSYVKVQMIAANVGGIVKFLILVGEAMIFYFRKMKYKLFILQFFPSPNEFIEIKERSQFLRHVEELANGRREINFQAGMSLNNLIGDELFRPRIVLPNNMRRPKLKKYSKRLGENFELISEIDLINCCNEDSRRKVWNVKKFYENVSFNFDFLSLLKLYNEQEFLKSFLLNKLQLNLLDICCKFSYNSEIKENYFKEGMNFRALTTKDKESLKESLLWIIENPIDDKNRMIIERLTGKTKKQLLNYCKR